MSDTPPRSATPEPHPFRQRLEQHFGELLSPREYDAIQRIQSEWQADFFGTQLARSVPQSEPPALRAALERITDLASRMYEDWPTIDMEIGRTIDEARAALSGHVWRFGFETGARFVPPSEPPALDTLRKALHDAAGTFDTTGEPEWAVTLDDIDRVLTEYAALRQPAEDPTDE